MIASIPSATTKCDRIYDYNLPSIPTPDDLPSFDNKIIYKTGLPLVAKLDSTQWKVRWSPSSIFSCDTCKNTAIKKLQDTIVEVTLTHITGCEYRKSFTITTWNDNKLKFPNIICPLCPSNKTWELKLPEDHKLIELSIFDRWSNVVANWQNTNEVNWDPVLNNRDIASGVYIYKIRYEDGAGQLHLRVGDVTVVR